MAYLLQSGDVFAQTIQPYGGFLMVLKRATCQSNYNLTETITTSSKYEASATIQATNIVAASANVTYDAAYSVLLLPGFQVQSGGIFRAYIDGCGNQ